MPPLTRQFKVTERDLRPGCRDIQVQGELDLAVAAQLDEVLSAASGECDCVLVGLERCDFIDSSGIAVILRAHNRMEEEGKRLVAYAPSEQVLRILTITGLTANDMVFDSAEKALSAVDETD
ncbi:MAG TPA: STAS domain-containing protein [Solirubrobacterales bacterium]|nr:STAS domain-containing protein [Solirubrobacterales bacterium]